ncbi:T9SS type A sorting domain-containing protein [Flavobacterium sp. F372]|jgi:PKD repeat protein|uniref:T9SS type A sorting domain-containing protein n=1 Tax=Flavobacterium bernardetii TaxID=2813823 RepID=A0ABR7J0X0_9FLAO|nr:T9SS type A sorting domain-containing protein [Flavobacterium bernardetii]MBC5835489.1 T9SS type A sorting domain-containing protein [Flavobacterium bernardetii]NHF69832.1 T9SS type A sorting domain-containing protein [Flavobacterium bernardetii]
MTLQKAIFFVLLVNLSFCQVTKRALFLGNSYTGVNNLPSLTQQVTASTGNTLIIDSNTPGGYTFQGHSTNVTSLQKIQQGNWDFVVLQEQSQIPSFPINEVSTICFPFATQLNNIILQYNPCAETVFYMTWGRENGDSQNCAANPPVCTYEGMDDLLRARYTEMANTNQAIISPVGAVWRYLRTNHPTLNLYSGDGSHPSLAGSYAAACTFNTVLFRNDPQLITFNSSLSVADAEIIKNAIKTVVYNNLSTWNVGDFDTTASFTSNLVSNLQFQFTNTSTNGTSYLWDFGDGTTSTDINPTHTYTTIENFNVILTVTNCGVSKQTNQFINLLSIDEFETNEFLIYPNPVTDIIHLNLKEEKNEISIYNSVSQLVLKTKNTNKIDVSEFAAGIYFIEINDFSKSKFVKFLKK